MRCGHRLKKGFPSSRRTGGDKLTHSNEWRIQQQKFANEPVEFKQDKRILDFFDNKPIRGIGEVEYFRNRLNLTEETNCTQVLLVVNALTYYKDLIKMLKDINGYDKSCVSINKFFLWTDHYNPTVDVNYDMALLALVQKCFPNKSIEHFFVKDLGGSHFNFASPTTQFYIT